MFILIRISLFCDEKYITIKSVQVYWAQMINSSYFVIVVKIKKRCMLYILDEVST